MDIHCKVGCDGNWKYQLLYICIYTYRNGACKSWYHRRSVTPISVLKAGHVEHLPQCIFFIICGFQSLSLFLTE